ncbi:hypothetical protein WDW89_26325 [Deltaproteobacteria bacterium TL4]
MNSICLLDTTVFVEILNVPQKANQHARIIESLEQKIKDNESLFLPMATILETGNHIGQNGNGNQRRDCAKRFVEQVTQAMEGKSPFKPISFLTHEAMKKWLAEFPDHASRGSGLGDLSIIHDWKRLCDQNPRRRVYIWTLDEHLASYDKPTGEP